MKSFILITTLITSLLINVAAASETIVKEESFPEFYKKFKVDDEFEYSRTIYPLKEIYYSGSQGTELSEEDKRKYKPKHFFGELAYPRIRMIENRGFSNTVFPKGVMAGTEVESHKRISSNLYESYIDLENGHRALTFTFKLINGEWFLVEYINIW